MQEAEEDFEEDLEDDLEPPGWTHEDLAPRLTRLPPSAAKAAIRAGSLESFLRAEFGSPPEEGDPPMLDSPEAADEMNAWIDAEEKAEAWLRELSEEEREALFLGLETLDPSGTLAERARNLSPSGVTLW